MNCRRALPCAASLVAWRGVAAGLARENETLARLSRPLGQAAQVSPCALDQRGTCRWGRGSRRAQRVLAIRLTLAAVRVALSGTASFVLAIGMLVWRGPGVNVARLHSLFGLTRKRSKLRRLPPR